MSQGVLLFAHNNERINYLLLAYWQAIRITKFLNKPCSVVTDQNSVQSLIELNLDPAKIFDKIILNDADTLQKKNYCGARLTFKNIDRYQSFELTPYEETVVFDTDIIIQSDRLNLLFDSDQDLMVCKHSSDSFQRRFTAFEKLSTYGIEFYWATIFYFRKSKLTETFFATCQKIKSMYNWYAHVYDVNAGYIRNDHVWSMALHELNYPCGIIPFNLYYILDTDNIVSMSDHDTVISNKTQLAKISNSDLHAMNKFDLVELVKKEVL
jgi:hypothetical protein